MDDEGGDAACWAHLNSFAEPPVGPVDLASIVSATDAHGPLWSLRSADLDLNVIAIIPDYPIALHTNHERDVLLVAIAGSGRITIDDQRNDFPAGSVIVVPKGAERCIEAISERFAYLTCHLQRPPLMPTIGKSKTS